MKLGDVLTWIGIVDGAVTVGLAQLGQGIPSVQHTTLVAITVLGSIGTVVGIIATKLGAPATSPSSPPAQPPAPPIAPVK